MELRRAAARGAGVPSPLGRYTEKITRHAYEVTNTDVDLLREAGYSEDQIFEATVAAAVGAGLRRIEAGLSTLR